MIFCYHQALKSWNAFHYSATSIPHIAFNFLFCSFHNKWWFLFKILPSPSTSVTRFSCLNLNKKRNVGMAALTQRPKSYLFFRWKIENRFRLFFSPCAHLYMFYVNNRNTRKRCEVCSMLTIMIPKRCH